MFGFDPASIIGKITEAVTGQFFSSAEKIFEAWVKGEISDDQKEMKLAELQSTMTTTMHEQATALQTEMIKSEDPFVRRAVPTAFWATLFIQVWYSFVQPLGVALAPEVFPVLRPGGTVEWNFIILLGVLGLHPASIAGTIGKLLKGK